MQKEFIARSKGWNGKPEQLYRDHVFGVYSIASSIAEKISKNMPVGDREGFIKNVKLASEYHDLGKLDQANQNALYSGNLPRLPYDHWRDGAKFLLKHINSRDSAMLSVAHHSCIDLNNLLNSSGESNMPNPNFLTIHDSEMAKIKDFIKTPTDNIPKLEKQILFRMGLSCIVNGDWDDSARAKDNPVPTCADTKWKERLEQLRTKVNEKTNNKSEELSTKDKKDKAVVFQTKRHKLRKNLWNRSKSVKIKDDVSVLSATVGMGKTFSFLQLALRKAIKQGAPHIIIVAPFNHIVDQLVGVIKDTLILDGEDPENIVGNHTCTATYENWTIQNTTSRWRCPIIVTSSVQFFETMSSNVAGKLVKLVEVPNSIVVMDEFHSIMEEGLIQYYWNEMGHLCNMFNTKFILSSGSMTRYWDTSFNNKFVTDNGVIIQDVTTKGFMKKSIKSEIGRVTYEHIGSLTSENLEDDVLNKNGKGKKTIVLMSTTRNVAVMAKRLINKGRNVYTVYGSLIDKDSSNHVSKIKNDNTDWIVICTTSIESGIDISCEVAYSVDRSIMSQVQLGGRVNREGNYSGSKVLVFKEITTGEFNGNSSFIEPSKITAKLDLLSKISNADECTHEYLKEASIDKVKKENLSLSVKHNNFPEISKQTRLINEGRGSVLVGPKAYDIYDRLTRKFNGEDINVSMKEIAQNSVPMPTIKTLNNADVKKDFITDDFEKVPGFTQKESKDEEISTLMYYKGNYDPDYFGIWKDKI